MRWKLILAGIVLVPVALGALYTAFVLNWSYSDGDRSGALYKFSRKGWICKTWEGELNITPGAASPTIWSFTVRDDAVAKQINEVLGSRVVLHYSEHVGVPTSCFGDTRYFVNAVRVVTE
ncbi:MAG: hypothetical protein FJ206_07370 [Gemmatimonadetes bacterium]|nr:hypothetical protein [Gemmatimonadota bacterium]